MPILPTLCTTGKSNGLQLRLLEGPPCPEFGPKTYFLPDFCRKLHENLTENDGLGSANGSFRPEFSSAPFRKNCRITSPLLRLGKTAGSPHTSIFPILY